MTVVSFIGSALPGCLSVGHCAEAGLEDLLSLPSWECTGLGAAATPWEGQGSSGASSLHCSQGAAVQFLHTPVPYP